MICDITLLFLRFRSIYIYIYSFFFNTADKSRSNAGWTTLHLASYFGQKEIVEELLKVRDVMWKIVKQWTGQYCYFVVAVCVCEEWSGGEHAEWCRGHGSTRCSSLWKKGGRFSHRFIHFSHISFFLALAFCLIHTLIVLPLIRIAFRTQEIVLLLLRYGACAVLLNGYAQTPRDITDDDEVITMLEGVDFLIVARIPFRVHTYLLRSWLFFIRFSRRKKRGQEDGGGTFRCSKRWRLWCCSSVGEFWSSKSVYVIKIKGFSSDACIFLKIAQQEQTSRRELQGRSGGHGVTHCSQQGAYGVRGCAG